MKLSDTVDLILKQKGRDVWSVSPDQSVYEAIERMADKGVGALLVISDGALVGIVSERDYHTGETLPLVNGTARPSLPAAR